MRSSLLATACVATFVVAALGTDASAKGGPGAGYSTASGRHVAQDPRRTIAAPGGGGLACVSVAGRTGNGEVFSGDPSNSVVSLNIGAGNALLGVAIDGVLTAHDPSFLSEAQITFSSSELEDPESITFTASETNDPGVETISTGGIDLFANFDLPPVATDADGILRIEFSEDFDDGDVDPDSTWSDASAPAVCTGLHLVCTDQAACDNAVNGTVPAPPVPYSYTPVPTLGQWSLGLLAGALGFLAFRNRRQLGRSN